MPSNSEASLSKATPYLLALKPHLPSEYSSHLDACTPSDVALVDRLLRFVAGGECPKSAGEVVQREWKEKQVSAMKVIRDLVSPSGQSAPAVATHSNGNGNGNTAVKRTRDDDDDDVETQVTKKSRTSPTPAQSPAPSSTEDITLHTFHALSLQAPLRKKLDISIHEHTLRLVNPSSQAIEASIPLTFLKRAFLLPTRGKTKRHWTVVLLWSDTPALTGKAAEKAAAVAAANGDEKIEERQVAFGIDAIPTAAFVVTDHTALTPSKMTHPKGTATYPALRTFLQHLPVPLIEPSTSVFQASSSSGGDPTAGVQAYRSAKEGTLWFLDGGVLWDGRPSEYWSLGDLVKGNEERNKEEKDNGGTGVEGVRISRRARMGVGHSEGGEEEDEEEEGEEEEEESVETDFGMVDGKEQEGIRRWVKARRHLFGVANPLASNTKANGKRKDVKGKGRAMEADEEEEELDTEPKVDVKGKGKAIAIEDDSEDSEDDDFVDGSESDGGSATSSSDDSDREAGDDNGSGYEDEDEDVDEDVGGEDEDGDEEMLDPKHHPLLRPGAMPRMSKAAIEAAVGMVSEDLFGGGGAGSGGSKAKEKGRPGSSNRASGSSSKGKKAQEEEEEESDKESEEEEEDEEDELDD
ncbi:hypothetical protein EW026_g4750 [Hermanssonia centrifuga]|uniref:Histone chaperone RTT106/FACT complex subunit SPT16-like middle domain-containing protein n=1 Tax=Hermanssonia centrifuga TaxID=98765 RepID=A0A4S4KG71_9APHY|nr:hypothetical protein EW026_g4750 [Hermanssonia centrifuga]